MTLLLDGMKHEAIAEAARLLAAGEVVAFPTETVYGLGGDGLSAAAVARVFAAKGRPADNPVILHVADFTDACPLWQADARGIARAKTCAARFWPGPLTLVLPASRDVPTAVTAGLESVGVRSPAHPVALDLLRALGRPLAAPSANRSGRPSPTTAAHVLRTLDKTIAAVLDGGPTEVGIESTVLDLRPDVPRVLRPGMISEEALRACLGEVEAYDPVRHGPAAASPGLRHRHYAPAIATLWLIPADALDAAWSGGDALLLRAATAARLQAELGPRDAPTEVLPDEPTPFAHALYAALYRLEQSGVERLGIETLPQDGPWRAVYDRVVRATAP